MRLYLSLAGLLALSVTAAAPAQSPGAGGRGGFSSHRPGGMGGGAFAAGSSRSHPGIVSFSTAPFPPRPLPLRPGTTVYSTFPDFGFSPFFGGRRFWGSGFYGGSFPAYGYGYAPGLGLGYGGYGDYDYWWPGFYDPTPDYPPAPLTLYRDIDVGAPPARWGSSTLQFAVAPRDPRAALLTVQLPTDGATVYLNGEKQPDQGGATRQITTPPLERGRGYEYEVKAVWTQDGRPVERVQRLTLHAGDQQSVMFLPAPPE